MQILQNETLKVSIAEKGAELKSVVHSGSGMEYMWSADPAYWAKTSPVLFPIIGSVKNDEYRHNGKIYRLPRHGFARDKAFTVTEKTSDSVVFTLQSDESTLAVYPFNFSLSLRYSLDDDKLRLTYGVKNMGTGEMLFSVGGHPAFKLPLAEGTAYEDYTLRFEKEETAGRWPISKDGLIEAAPLPFLNGSREVPLTKEIFAKDAVVLKHLQSNYVELVSHKTPHGFRFLFEGFPYLGLWAAPGADFVCIEPWQGIADGVGADGELAHKEGIVRLPEGGEFRRHWDVQFF